MDSNPLQYLKGVIDVTPLGIITEVKPPMPQTLTIIAIAVLAALAMGVALYIRRVGRVKDESQNGIRNLVTNFIRMTFGNRF